MTRKFVVNKDDVDKVKQYAAKWDYDVTVFPITMTPRMRKIVAKYMGRTDTPSKFKNSKGFDEDLKQIRIYEKLSMKRVDRLYERVVLKEASFIKNNDYTIKLKNDFVLYKFYTFKGVKLGQLIFKKSDDEISINKDDIESAFDQDKRIWVVNESFKEASDIEDISTIDTGYFSKTNKDSVVEFTDWYLRYMNKFGIGTKISRKYWGDRKTRQLQSIIYDTVMKRLTDKKDVPAKVPPVKKATDLYDDFRQDVRSKDHTKSDFARVARTETSNMKAVYQLQTWAEAGVEEVIHKNNPGSVARKTVSPRCKQLNNRVFKISYLLSRVGEKDRICIHPNCQCRYLIKVGGS